MAAKTYRYTVERASGEIESFRIPSFFTPYEVAKRLVHSVVFLHVPPKHSVFATSGGSIEGPALALVDSDEKVYRVPLQEIRNASDAMHCWRNRS